MSDERCLFDWKYDCAHKSEKLIESGTVRIQNIIRCSKTYGDTSLYHLETKLNDDPSLKVKCHKSCVSSYTMKSQIKRHTQKLSVDSSEVPRKMTRRSTDTTIFCFQQQCLFCGDRCEVNKDPKHPSRWRPAYICRKVSSEPGQLSFKQMILNTCDKRNDLWAEKVRRRVDGALSDLHAADARYHVDCRANFLSEKSVACASTKINEADKSESAFEKVVSLMKDDTSKVWNSIELFQAYSENGGTLYLRETLIKKISERFGDELIILHSPGLANMIMFRRKAAESMKLVNDEEDDIDQIIGTLSKKIVDEIKVVSLDKSKYESEINRLSTIEKVSNTLLKLLTKVSPKLDKTLPAILIGSMVTSIVKNYPTGMQVALGVKMGRSKQLVKLLQEFGVTCTYDEVLRFKRSAAIATTKDRSLTGLSDASSGLVQVVADNFDADISSQNGKLSTHSLAVLITQPDVQTEPDGNTKCFKRILKEEMTETLDYDIGIERYHGPPKPAMPNTASARTVLPLSMLCQQVLSTKRAENLDFAFIKDIVSKKDIPEFNGYNTEHCRNEGKPIQSKTKSVYLPLIDMTPSNPDTMMTAMVKAQGVTDQTGQKFAILTCDLQLYKVALEVKWAYPKRFENVILRLGGMHTLMSFVGAIGTLMADSGLADILADVFGGVPKMLTGKKFPQNVRAMRIVAEELLRSIIENRNPETKEEMMKLLNQIASENKTAKLWVEVFMTAVFIMMLYIRAEREGDWALHLAAYRQMLPYFFAAGHVNYARYGVCYVKAMESLPDEVSARFVRGEHVMRHERGIWNGIWSDMFIETTFMRYGHAPGGIIGITLKPETLKVWALSLHTCSQLEACLDDMVNDSGDNGPVVLKHKEEQRSRVESDAKDREGIRNKLKSCIDPLEPTDHRDELVNIVSGEVSTADVNVHNSVAIGREQLASFEGSLPEGLYDTIHKKVVTMSACRKHVKIGQERVIDTNLIYSRVLGLQASGRDVDIKDVLSHELAPIPTALFDEHGDMRISKSKSTLKKQLQVEVSSRVVSDGSIVVIDGSALLWVIPYPAEGKVQDFLNNIKLDICKRLKDADVYLIFDRYYDFSTKSTTRTARATGASRVYQLHPNSKLPAQKVLLTVTENKKKLIRLLFSDILKDSEFQENNTDQHKFVITGENKIPVEICAGVPVERQDLETKLEEADNIIIQQVLAIIREDANAQITVVCDDTDVFVLLLHYYHKTGVETTVLMESPIKGRVVIDIGKTVEKHKDIVGELLSAHALSGCDTVACCFGIGKGTALKVIRNGFSLSLLGIPNSDLEAVIVQATVFISACYGDTFYSNSMSETRFQVWSTKIGRGMSSTKLSSLPPTSEAFAENVKRAHYQACLWHSLQERDPPDLDPTCLGWKKDVPRKSLQPITVPEGTCLAPEFILKLIKCGCQSANPCSTRVCSCKNANMSCTMFCACYNKTCYNI